MGAFNWLITHIAPIFIVSSPITSYVDQIYSMHRLRTSAGFSLDIPLIMLVASILKQDALLAKVEDIDANRLPHRIFYWLGAHYDTSLLLQAVLMVFMQSLLLYTALLHRAPPAVTHTPFSDAKPSTLPSFLSSRPYNFWQWRTQRPYWAFLLYFSGALLALQLLVGRSPTVYPGYTALLGSVALAIEATLPLPQIHANHARRCCRGFRLSVLANWLVGDAFKMMFFFAKGADDVPWAFKLCGIFQALCDVYLGVQYAMYGDGEVRRPWEETVDGLVPRQTQPAPQQKQQYHDAEGMEFLSGRRFERPLERRTKKD